MQRHGRSSPLDINRIRSHDMQNGSVTGLIKLTVPLASGSRYTVRAAALLEFIAIKGPSSAVTLPRTSELLTNSSRHEAAAGPIGMSSMKRICHVCGNVRRARSVISSSFTPRITTQFSLTGRRPASSAAAIPSRTVASDPPPLIPVNLSSLRLSRLTLTRRTPAAARSRA